VVLGLFARANTLMELVVAMCILSAIVAMVGYVFTETSQAVDQSLCQLESAAAVRVISQQLREDIRQVAPEGFLLIANPPPDCSSPPLLMMTATGRFVSQTDRDPVSGRSVTANAALIVYTLGRDSRCTQPVPAGKQGILCRYVYLLTGSGQFPRNLADLFFSTSGTAGTSGADGPNAMDNSDVLGDSLADVATAPYVGTYGFKLTYVQPATEGYWRINTAPAELDSDDAGGVKELWPYLAAGAGRLAFSFYDGFAADGVTPASGPTVRWLLPSQRPLGTTESGDNQGLLCRRLSTIFWRRSATGHLPKAVRLQLIMVPLTGNGQEHAYELILTVPQ